MFKICTYLSMLSILVFSLSKECSKSALTCPCCPFLCSVCPKNVQNLHLPVHVVHSCVQFVQRMFKICTHVSMLSILLFSLSKESAIRSNCNFSSPPFGCVQHMHLKSPANENSKYPSSSSLFFLSPLSFPQNDLFFASFFASSAVFFSCSNS